MTPHGVKYETGTAATTAQKAIFRGFMKKEEDHSSLSETAHLWIFSAASIPVKKLLISQLFETPDLTVN